MDDQIERSRRDPSDEPVGAGPQPEIDADLSGAIAGTDSAALGLGAPAGLDPTQAQVDPTSTETPAAFDQQAALRESKPWSTSLAYQSPQAGLDAQIDREEEGHVGRAAGEGVPPDRI